MQTVGWDSGDRGHLSCPEGPTSRDSSMWAALHSLEALHKAEIWWFKGKQDHVQLLHPSPAHSSQNHGRSCCHTNLCWGTQRGPPVLVLLLGTSAEKHQEFTGENFPLWDCFIECLTAERTSHIAELKHLINTDESVTVWRCTAGGGGLYLGEYIWERNICWPFQVAWMGSSQLNLCLFHSYI